MNLGPLVRGGALAGAQDGALAGTLWLWLTSPIVTGPTFIYL